jgi:hypothetical protein
MPGQVPAVQLAGCVWIPDAQLAGRHCVPGYVHAVLEDAHDPPQGATPSPAQCVRAPCGWPDVSCVHVPFEPSTSHALHCSAHALSQQTASTQWP